MGFAGSQADRYRGVKRGADTAKALSSRWPAWEILFPPHGTLDIGDPPEPGNYAVITATGSVGDPNSPPAQYHCTHWEAETAPDENC